SADFAATPYRRYAASDGDRMRWQRTQAELTWRIRGPAFDLRTTAYHHMLLRRWTKVNRFAGGPDLHDLLLADPGGRAGVFQAILRGDQDSATPDEQIMVGTNDRRFHSLGLQSTAHWQASAGPVQSRLELGLRVHGDLVDRTHTEDPFAMVDGARVATGGATLTTLDVHTEALALAAHAHEDLGIGPVRVLPGVRVEVVQTAVEEAGVREDPTWRAIGLPGLGVVGQATWWLDLFAGVHRGFSPVAPRSPADTRPETSWNVEAGARATTGSTRAEAVGFYVDYDNLTGQCTFSAGCADDQLDAQLNGGAVDVYGVEALVAQEIRLPHQLELLLEGSYTWTGSRFRTGFESSFPQFGRVEAGDALP
ncbi:MAG: TonB-dependent receptor, partial [Myxococcales bacterium]|nr:TonB-dependent receptor [Myxococcales bacterium]